MSYRGSYLDSRKRYLDLYSPAEVEKYEAWVSELTHIEHEACLADMAIGFAFAPGMQVLDAGAGTGALCTALVRLKGLHVTALEPCRAMLDKLRKKDELRAVATVESFCDHPGDRAALPLKSFDVVASRQLANSLFDPICAFSNWWAWLKPGGAVVLMDGLFDRSSWTGAWDEEVDRLPLSVCQTQATVPYLLEHCGFEIQFVGPMRHTNELASTRTPRYIVVAHKPT